MHPAEETDGRLLARAREGDGDAFGALVQRYERLVYRVAYRLLGDPDEADDAAQEVFVRLFESLADFRGEAKLSTWLYRATRNLCVSALRRPRPVVSLEEIEEASLGNGSRLGNGDPAEALLRQETTDLVQQALRALPAMYRTLIVLRHLEGLSYADIAQVTCLPVGKVKSRLFRARELLREELIRVGCVEA
jgi:RNA polymerase sigma-70 factor (ECF subfamily)